MSANYNFGAKFMESKGNAISHQGHELHMSDKIPAALGDVFKVTIESTASKYVQGVGFSEGVEVFGVKQKRAVVWEIFSVPPQDREKVRSVLPYSFEVTCRSKRGFVRFYNMALEGDRQSWWTGGSAMIIEEVENGHRCRCNDFELDDDFCDIVFTVEKSVSATK
jgi:hypothetical protein